MPAPQPSPTFIDFWRHEACKYSTLSSDPLIPALTKALDLLAVAGDPNYNPIRLQRTLASLKSESELSYSFENNTKPDPCRVLTYGVLLSLHHSFSQMVVRVDGDDAASVTASESQESAAVDEESAVVPAQSAKRRAVSSRRRAKVVRLNEPQSGAVGEAVVKKEVEEEESDNTEQTALAAQEEFPLFDNTIKNDDEIKQEPPDEMEEADATSTESFSLFWPDTAPEPSREEEVVTTDGDEEMGVEEEQEEGDEEAEEEEVDSDHDSDNTYIQSDDEFDGMPILEKMV